MLPARRWTAPCWCAGWQVSLGNWEGGGREGATAPVVQLDLAVKGGCEVREELRVEAFTRHLFT